MSALKTCPDCGFKYDEESPFCPGCVFRHPLRDMKAEAEIKEKPGDRIGLYKLLQQIGEGAFGVVYMAQQEGALRRLVAVKILKLGMDTKQVVARFEAERQSLAMMDHPNIARVLAAGATDSGRPYFVMELVRGVAITKYCDNQNLNMRQRLELFIQVCQAVQHAHQKGIIHRDIKPSNVLVTESDGMPVPKVIDFGIAKAITDQHLTDKTLFTAFGQLLGTPGYMSPEQAGLGGLDIDTRTDIYSLGVLLYELLTGRTPFGTDKLHQAAADEMFRIIREQQPPRPSVRLTTLTENELATVAQRRHVDPIKLPKLIRRDLDWVVMKALEKERPRRYSTANDLAADVHRFLKNEPIIARPPSPVYRFQKLVRRNRLGFMAASAVTAALVIGLALFIWQYREKNHAYQLEVKAEALAQAQTKETQAALAEQTILKMEALKTASATDFAFAVSQMEKKDWSATLAYLADALRKNPQNEKAMVMAVSLIRKLPLPVAAMRHENRVDSARFSLDGKWVLTMSKGEARVWDSKTGRLLSLLTPNDDKIKSSSFSPDGRWVVSASTDTVRVWDTQTGKPVGSPIKPGGYVSSASFSSDGKSVMTESKVKVQRYNQSPNGALPMSPGPDVEPDDSWDGYSLRLWDTKTSLPIGQPMKNNFGKENSANISQDSQWVVTVLEDTAQVWNARTGQPVGKPMKHHRGAVSSVRFSPDGQRVLLALAGTTQLWDPQTGLSVGTLMEGAEFSSFSPDGRWVLTVSHDTARVWDADSGLPAGRPIKFAAAGNVFTARFSPNSKWVVTEGINNTLRLWDAQSGQPVGNPINRGEGSFSIDFSPDSQWMVIGSDKSAQIRKAKTSDLEGQPMSHIGMVNSASFSPNGQCVLTTSDDNTVRIWEAPGRAPVGRPMQHDGDVMSANISPDGQWVLVETITADEQKGSADIGGGMVLGNIVTGETIQVCNAKTGQLVGHSIKLNRPTWSMSFSPDSNLILIVLQGGTARVWNAQTGEPRSPPMENVGSARFSPDSHWLLTVSVDHNSTQIIDAQTGLPVGQPMKGGAASFSPDGKYVVTESEADTQVWDVHTGQPLRQQMQGGAATFSPNSKRLLLVHQMTARVWDIQTGQPVGSLMKQNGGISTVSFSPNGRSIVTMSGNKVAQVWDAETGQPTGRPMKCEDPAISVCFSPDSKYVVSWSEWRTYIWDAQTGQPASVPVDGRWSGFSPDGQSMLLVSHGGARLCDATIADRQAPSWLADLAEVVGGRSLNSQGALEPALQDPAKLCQELQHLRENDDLSRFGRWIENDPGKRLMDPFAMMTVPEFIAACLQRSTPDSIKEAYDANPGDPLALAALARLTFESDQDQARFYFRIALRYARLAGVSEDNTKVQAMAKSIFPKAPEFSDAANSAPLIVH